MRWKVRTSPEVRMFSPAANCFLIGVEITIDPDRVEVFFRERNSFLTQYAQKQHRRNYGARAALFRNLCGGGKPVQNQCTVNIRSVHSENLQGLFDKLLQRKGRIAFKQRGKGFTNLRLGITQHFKGLSGLLSHLTGGCSPYGCSNVADR